MKKYYEYEYVLSFGHRIVKEKDYYKDFEAAIKAAMRRLNSLQYVQNLRKFEVRSTGMKMTR